MLYTLRFFFSSKCSLFHNAYLFGSCIIHILYTGCAKIKKKNPAPKGYSYVFIFVNNFSRVTSGFRHEVDVDCALLCHYAASSG